MREATSMPETAEPLLPALAQIKTQGSLLALVPDRVERVGLMKTMSDNRLVTWNAVTGSYKLTPFGEQRLAEYRATSHEGTVAGI